MPNTTIGSYQEIAVQDPDNNNLNPQNSSLDTLILLLKTDALKNVDTQSKTELEKLKKRQAKVAELHNILKAINAATDKDGKINCSKDDNLKGLLKRANELGKELGDNITLEIKTKEGAKDAFVFSKQEVDTIVDTINMTVGDLNTQNDMQLQTVSRLTNERYEIFQLARSLIKTLHDTKTTLLKAIKG